MELLAGALLERPPGPKYTSELRFAELAPQAPLPKPGTLAKWRQKLPDGFELALRAPDPCWQSPGGPLRPSRELEAGLGWLSEAADALQASMIVVSTSAAVTTGARDRERLRAYFARVPRTEGRLIVWRPTGLWEPETVQTLANTLSLVGGLTPSTIRRPTRMFCTPPCSPRDSDGRFRTHCSSRCSTSSKAPAHRARTSRSNRGNPFEKHACFKPCLKGESERVECEDRAR
jgi:hypothetical protein